MKNMKRRWMLVTDETARHPFLASLPPHVRRGTEPLQLQRHPPRLSLDSLREFLIAYCACFVAVSAFIA